MTKFLWKIGGEAGFGIMTCGLTFSKIASRLGYHVFDLVSYPSLIRGGHNSYEVVVCDEPISALKQSIDVLVCLNEETFKLHRNRLNEVSCIIYDEQEFKPEGNFVKINVPFNKIINDLKGRQIMKNTVALSASLALLGGDIEVLNDLLREEFIKKGEAVVTFNKNLANQGFNHIKNNYSDKITNYLRKIENFEKKLVMSGNDAFSLASVVADCRLYAAYPMTPASSVLSTLAAWQEKCGMVVRHAEDEIGVINEALGAAFSGARSSVGTSGGGFALMVESISLAGVTETPIVIFLSQRPGPATGMPTWTEQGDLLFAINAGHGEFPKIILAPGDIDEMINLGALAYDLADIYQTPVIVLSDMFLSESHQTINKKNIDDFIGFYKPDRGKTISSPEKSNYKRYEVTEDGVSPRLIPRAKNYFYQANSYEHSEDGHTSEDPKVRKAQVDKRNRKATTYLKNHFVGPKVYGDIDSAEIIFVSWGSLKGTIIEAQKQLLSQKNRGSAFIHFTHVFPLDPQKILPMFNKKARYILVENNSQGQFGKLLRQETGIEIKEKILKYDGRMFYPEEIVSDVNELTN